MARATEDLVRQPKLLQIGQPLELPRVVELGGQRRQIKVFVHRVVEVLRTPTRACSAATAVRSFGAAQQRGAFVHCAALTGGRSCHLPLVASLGSPQRHKHEPPQPRAGQSCCLLHSMDPQKLTLAQHIPCRAASSGQCLLLQPAPPPLCPQERSVAAKR